MKKYVVIIVLFVMLGIGCKHAKEHNTISTGNGQPVGTEQVDQPTGGAEKKGTEGTAQAKDTRGGETQRWRISHMSVPGGYVALTFDDGPSARFTPKVLDILKKHRVKATFFVLGENVARNKDIVARAAAEGHEIASHSWNHPNLSKMSRAQVISQMDRTSAVIREATGHTPTLMRPPYGATNRALGNMLMTRYGMASVLWDVDTVDWKHPGVNVVINRAVRGARNGSIILLHDIHASTLQAVEGVVEGLLARGFKPVTVSELMRIGHGTKGGGERQTGQGSGSIGGTNGIANTLPPSDEGVPLPNTPEPQPVPQPTPQPEPHEPTLPPQKTVAGSATLRGTAVKSGHRTPPRSNGTIAIPSAV